MVKKENIWKFNDDEWKVHVSNKTICEEIYKKFKLKQSTIYYETGILSEETSWDVIVPNKLITKVKKLLKETT